MLNKDFIFEKISSKLNQKQELSYDEFDEAFAFLPINLQYRIVDILAENRIFLVDNKQKDFFEKECINCKPNLINKSLYHLSNNELISMYKNGSENALVILINKNKNLIAKFATKLGKEYENDLCEEDLIQYGVIGFINGINKFDVTKGNAMSTYVSFHVRQQVLRGIEDYGRRIRIPVHMNERIIKIAKLKEQFPDISNENFLKELEKNNISPKMYYDAMQAKIIAFSPAYLDEKMDEDSSLTLMNKISNNYESNYKSPEILIEEKELQKEIVNMISLLKQKERDVICMRYGFTNDNKKRTLEEIGCLYGVTRERIRQIEKKAILKLRRYCKNNEKLIPYLTYFDNVKVEDICDKYLFKNSKGKRILPNFLEIIKRISKYDYINEPLSEIKKIEMFEDCAVQNGYKEHYLKTVSRQWILQEFKALQRRMYE